MEVGSRGKRLRTDTFLTADCPKKHRREIREYMNRTSSFVTEEACPVFIMIGSDYDLV